MYSQLSARRSPGVITSVSASEQIPDGQQKTASEKELATIAANWPGDLLVEIWNSFAGAAGLGADLSSK